MISHKHKCIFVHVPKTAGKSILGLFGLPEFGRDYVDRYDYIEHPYDHRPLIAYRQRDYFDHYFKFAFVRNPWDRALSTFLYLLRGGSNDQDARFRDRYLANYGGNFEAFVQDLPAFLDTKFFAPQFVWICDSEKRLIADFVGRFETLDQDLASISRTIAIDLSSLDHRNVTEHRPYGEYYTAKSRDIVAQVYARDLDLFGYTFEQELT